MAVSATTNSPHLELPIKVFTNQIVNKLDPFDLLQVFQVCRAWRAIDTFSRSFVWRRLCLKENITAEEGQEKKTYLAFLRAQACHGYLNAARRVVPSAFNNNNDANS